MKTIREKINFKIWKKGRKWIQCYFSFEHEGRKNSVQGKILITDFLKDKQEGEWINNLAAEITISENSYTRKVEFTARPFSIITDNSFEMQFGKHKFESIKSVEENDFNYLMFMKDKASGEFKNQLDEILSNYKIVEKFEDIYHYECDVRRDQNLNPNPKEIEGYELFTQESFDDNDGCLVQRDIYKKIGGERK